jgi:hypothetical protein
MQATSDRIRRARFHTKPDGLRFKITQKEADGFGVTGFVGRVTFKPVYGRRGARDVRPLRTEAKATLEQAITAAEKLAAGQYFAGKRPAIVDTVDVHEIDSLGREVER